MKIKNLRLAQIVIATLAFQHLTFNSLAQASFLPAITFAAGSYPLSVITSDFNLDGKADLAIINDLNGNGNISVLLGNGEGGFAAATNFAVGTNPHSITSSDFNGDGKSDLAVTDYSDNIVILLLGNGLGGFSTTSFPAPISPTSIISADLNNDGKADLVVAGMYNNIVSVFLGDGAGDFVNNSTSTVDLHPISLTSADFNGDGNLDLAAACESSITSVLLGDGLGGFGALANYAVGSYPNSVISDDFNGDGDADLATANQGSNNISILLGNGSGIFDPATNFAADNHTFDIISADFNADGNVDLAAPNVNSNNVSVLLGNGAGGFGAANNFAVGTGPRSAINADFNGDGKADLAITGCYDNNVSILLNNYIPPSAPICLVTVDSTLTHNVVVWEKSNLDLTAIDSFIVYREITTNDYQRIGAVSKDSMSTFDDFEANPAATAFRYKIKNKYLDGITSHFSEYHNTMYLTHAGADFSWTPYQIENNTAPVAAYKIYRDDNSTGNFQTIGTTTGNQLGFTDVNYASYPNAQYYVEAVMIAGSCQPSRSGFMASRSNVKHIGSSGVQQLNNPPSVIIFPNPLSNMLNITGIIGKTTLRLYNLVGKLVMEEEMENNTTLSTILLADGIYTLLSENKVGKAYHKVVISH